MRNSKTLAKFRVLSLFVGRGSLAFFALVATPFYIRFLGIKGYGLIGFYSSLCALFSMIDFGLGEAFCREAACHSLKKGSSDCKVVKTLELLYWMAGGILCLLLLVLSPLIAEKWLYGDPDLSAERALHLLRLMSIALFFFWPTIFYSKGLQGLQAHLTNNLIVLAGGACRYIGAIALLAIYPTLEAFFYWQIVSSFLHTTLAFFSTWKRINYPPFRCIFSLTSLSKVWKFSLGMSLMSITSLLLLQVDKFIVSHYFSLEKLGIYCLASTAAASLYYFAHPIGSYFYPIFIQCVEKKDFHSLQAYYTKAFFWVICAVLPFFLLILFFGKELIALWTAEQRLAQECAPLIKYIASGTLLNCCMSIIFYVYFSFQNTHLFIKQNLAALILLAPLFFFSAPYIGLAGIACFPIVLNSSYLILNLPNLQQRLLCTRSFLL